MAQTSMNKGSSHNGSSSVTLANLTEKAFRIVFSFLRISERGSLGLQTNNNEVLLE